MVGKIMYLDLVSVLTLLRVCKWLTDIFLTPNPSPVERGVFVRVAPLSTGEGLGVRLS
jgi:hypothetical protein